MKRRSLVHLGVDLQEKMCAPMLTGVFSKASELAQGCRGASIRNIWIAMASSADLMGPDRLCVERAKSEPIIPKDMPSGFSNPALEEDLCRNKADTLIVSGVSAGACVRGTAIDAAFGGYKVILATDAINYSRPDESTFRQHYGALYGDSIFAAPVAQIVKAVRSPA
jgi:nicotinamidase-related amidase